MPQAQVKMQMYYTQQVKLPSHPTPHLSQNVPQAALPTHNNATDNRNYNFSIINMSYCFMTFQTCCPALCLDPHLGIQDMRIIILALDSKVGRADTRKAHYSPPPTDLQMKYNLYPKFLRQCYNTKVRNILLLFTDTLYTI